MEPGFLVAGAFLAFQVGSSSKGDYITVAVSVGMDSWRVVLDNMGSIEILKGLRFGSPVILSCRPYVREKGGIGLAAGRLLAYGDDAELLMSSPPGVR